MHVLITARDRHEKAMEAARILTGAGLFPLVWTPEGTFPEGWMTPGGADTEDTIIRQAVAYSADRDSGLILLPLDRGWQAGDALAVAGVMAEKPGALALARRTGPLPAGERFVARVYALVQGRSAEDLYAGLMGWPPALVRELNRPARLPAVTRALMLVRELGLPVAAVPLVPPEGQPARPARALIMDTVCFLAVFLRFTGSSILSAAVDYGLYAALLLFIASPEIAYVVARVFSSAFNFTLNRTLVFQSRGERVPLLQALGRYYLLAAVIAGAGAGILHLFSTIMGFNEYVVKLLGDIVLYIINFLVQRELIFHKRRRIEG